MPNYFEYSWEFSAGNFPKSSMAPLDSSHTTTHAKYTIRKLLFHGNFPLNSLALLQFRLLFKRSAYMNPTRIFVLSRRPKRLAFRRYRLLTWPFLKNDITWFMSIHYEPWIMHANNLQPNYIFIRTVRDSSKAVSNNLAWRIIGASITQAFRF